MTRKSRILIPLLMGGIVLTGVSCSSEPEWQDSYATVVREAFDDGRRTDQRANCRQARRLADNELADLMLSASGDGNSNFEMHMTELGLTPTDEDFTEATEIAIGVIREACVEFDDLAEQVDE